ncbi:hypothetical protein BLA29_014443, partial [Euroglyphus maynei]
MEKSQMNYPYDQPPATATAAAPRSMLQHQLELPINNNESSSYQHGRQWSTSIDTTSMMMNQTLYGTGYSSMYNNNNNDNND